MFQIEHGIHHLINRGKKFCRRFKTALEPDETDHLLFKGNADEAVAALAAMGMTHGDDRLVRSAVVCAARDRELAQLRADYEHLQAILANPAMRMLRKTLRLQ